MESIDDTNSSDMENYPNDNNHFRSSMEACSSAIEDESEVNRGMTDGKEETVANTLRKFHFQSSTNVPKVAVQEKIIICIENSQEKSLGYTFSDLDQNSKEPNTHIIRNEAIRIFMTNKLALAKDTEFAIASVEPGKFQWLSPFTSNLTKLSNSLGEHKYIFKEESNQFDITPIFSNVLKLIDTPEHTTVTITPPNYVIRIIFLYSSSFLVPQINTKDPSYLKYFGSPYCFLDIFYLHEKQTDFNSVYRIYQELGKIVPPSSYLLEHYRDVTKVFNTIMKLLAHPTQRVVDTVWNF